MKTISPKQQEILNFIDEFITDRGYPPTVREIGKAVHLSSSASVHSQLNKLEAKGYIKKDATTSRAINIVKEDKNQFISIPMVGLVTAGNPIEAIENVTDYFPVPSNLIKGNEVVFGLEISGNSMKNAGILDHDKVIIRKTDVASNGEIVVALTNNNEATVKRFYKEKDHFRLQPENDDFEPIILNDVKIIGKVIGVFRDLS
ncbi:transcriptional repressor LexA [Mycoplasmatota bacterium]|nr:transcriptional repressor LexA [Mycoplasmatota bacterium]